LGAGEIARKKKMFRTLRYYWIVARGYRLKPWDSPYLRWRFETFLGSEAANMTPQKFIRLSWKYRSQLERFVDWATERRRLQRQVRHHA
jgi:hypothetical protein